MESLEVLSAFMDGDAVSPESLAVALQASGGRQALLDFARLRATLADESQPSAAFYAAAREGGVEPRLGWRGPIRLAGRVAAVVVLALAGLGASDLLGWLRLGLREEPPRAARVITFTTGVDWHENASGAGEKR